MVESVSFSQDAILAINQGVKAIMVSNHGGRQLDGVEATLDALPEIARAVKTHAPEVEVYLDGGVREGADVLKALALGAKMVCIGRPVLWGLAYGGQKGVELTLDILRKELDLAMSLSGSTDVNKINPNLVRCKPFSKV